MHNVSAGTLLHSNLRADIGLDIILESFKLECIFLVDCLIRNLMLADTKFSCPYIADIVGE